MIKFMHIAIFTLIFILISSALVFSQENITISTYYPSPMGVYRVLKLEPGDGPASCQLGEMYFSSGNVTPKGIYLCTDSGWQRLLLFSEIPPPAGLWRTSGSNIYKANAGNVGIGTATPDKLLTVAGALHVTTGDAKFDQNVGIGTTPSATDKLIVSGSINAGSIRANNYITSGGNVGASGTTTVGDVLVPGSTCDIDYENGLITGFHCP